MTRRPTKSRNAPPEDVPPAGLDRPLPHDLDAERAVLGAILVRSELFLRTIGTLTAGDFFRLGHRHTFEAMQTLDRERKPIDLLTVKAELERADRLEDAGGVAYLSAMLDGVPRSANVEHYAGIVKEHATRRRVIELAAAMMSGAYAATEPVETLIASADRGIVDVQRGAGPGRVVDLRTTQGALLRDVIARGENSGTLSGLTSGFPSIDEITFGWQKGDMIVVAARPSMGKSAFCLNTAMAAARADVGAVLVFSLEMRQRQIESRLLAAESGVPLSRILSGYLGEQDFEVLPDAIARLEAMPIFVDDRGGIDVWEIRSTCRRIRAEHGLALVIVDYVQLIPGTLERRGATRNEEIADISRRLKTLADEVQAPIIVCSQLSRRGSGERPQLSDLRDSGALEQDADLVGFLHRKHHRENGETAFILEKQRNGATGTVLLNIQREIQRFTDAGVEPEPQPEQAKLPDEHEEPRRKVPPGFSGRRRYKR